MTPGEGGVIFPPSLSTATSEEEVLGAATDL